MVLGDASDVARVRRGEANRTRPLGRAVIGGLCLATVTTLFFVPIMYTLLRRTAPVLLSDTLDD